MFVTNIDSDIRLYRLFWYWYIRTFVHVLRCNIFGHSFVSMKTIRIFLEFSVPICIWTFVHVKFLSRLYSDLRLYHLFYVNMFGLSFVLKLLWMSHSEPESSLLVTKHMSPNTGSHQITPNLINNACTWRPMRRFHVFATYTCYLRWTESCMNY